MIVWPQEIFWAWFVCAEKRASCAGKRLDEFFAPTGYGKVIQSFPISAGVDANVFEPSRGILFVSTRGRKIHIYHEDTPDKFSEVETVTTEYGAKTMAVYPKTHNLFLTTSDFGQPPAPTKERPNPQRLATPGTFRLLVCGK
jgi:hypothetical protein